MEFGSTAVRIILTIAAVVVAQLLIHRYISIVVRRVVKTHHHQTRAEEIKRENTLISIFRTASAVVLWVVGVAVVLGELHVNIAAFMTGAGVLGVVVGFGAQNTIKDFLAGIFVIAENQYRVGDIVSMYAGGAQVAGVVEEITIRITKLRDLDGYLHIVPNGSAGTVTNLSYKFANVNVDVNVSYASDVDKVKAVINKVGEVMAAEEPWSDNILEPIKFLRVDSFNDSSVTIKSVGKVKPATQWDTAGEFRRRIKLAFEQQGIEIPLPQIVIHNAKK
jgi:small-conductance mechanosensitive channel